MLLLFLFIPLLCIFILNLPNRETGGRLATGIVNAVCIFQAALAVTSSFGFWHILDSIFRFTVYLPQLPSSIDYFSATVLFTIAIVAAAANAVGSKGDSRQRLSLGSLTLILMAGMNGAVMARDLFTLYIFIEICAVASFVLIAMEKKAEALEGAFKYFILSSIATSTMLVASAFIFMHTGSLNYTEVNAALSTPSVSVRVALALYVVAFCVKAGVAPFHGWLPGAHSAAPDAVSVLLSGIVIKVGGAYVIIRLMSNLFVGQKALGTAFMCVGAFSIIIGAFAAIGQKNIKRVLAYSSVSQMGYIVLAAGLGTPLAIIGALLHLFNHAVFKSLLFVNAAAVKEQTGTADMENLGGLAEKMKITGWTSVLGSLSAAGIPPLGGFWSKLLIIMALAAAGHWFFAALALLMSVVTLAYLLIVQHKVFFGKLHEGLENINEARLSLRITSISLAALTVLAGLLFPVILVILHSRGLL